MLDEVSSKNSVRTVYRLSRVSANDDQFLAELNLDAVARGELLELLTGQFPHDVAEELIEGPFRPKKKLFYRTRYSDGSFAVFYSSLATETAAAEVAYWYRREYVGRPRKTRTAYYQGFHCTFEGLEKDLRSKVSEWHDLVHDRDYSFCNRLGAEAKKDGLDGLVVPSARHEGANMPIFVRQAVSGPELDGVVKITFSPDTNDLSINGVA